MSLLHHHQDETSVILKANDQYVTQFSPEKSALPLPPARHLAIVCCMDARIDVAKATGLVEGDAHVIRNAGGRIQDSIRSLAISQTLLGTKEVIIIHHTDCGMLTFSDSSIREQLRRDRSIDADNIAFLPFSNIEQSIIDDIHLYKKQEILLQDISVRGFIYDVKTGRLNEVKI